MGHLGSGTVQATAAHGGRRHAMISSSMQWHRALRSKRRGHEAVLFAFDLIEHDGDDLRDQPLIERKRGLAKLIGKAKRCSLRFVEHRLSKVWLKSKNPASAAVRRECEEEWRKTRPRSSDA
jgi:ATP-dependent DNA ligase